MITALRKIFRDLMDGLSPVPDYVVERKSTHEVQVRSCGRLTTFDMERRVMEQAGRAFGNFDDVREVSVNATAHNQQEMGVNARVNVVLNSGDSIWIAKTKESVDASIIGAEVATLLGVKVLTHRSPRSIWP